MVHPVRAVLAAGIGCADRLPVCLAAEHSISHCWHHFDRRLRFIERNPALAGSTASRAACDLNV